MAPFEMVTLGDRMLSEHANEQCELGKDRNTSLAFSRVFVLRPSAASLQRTFRSPLVNRKVARPRINPSQVMMAKKPRSKQGLNPASSANRPPDRKSDPNERVLRSAPGENLPKPEITRDIRLREELSHPFRTPKLVIFGTLALSAVVGSFFALGRFSLGADPLEVFLQNSAINTPAALLFGWLAKREVDFGRRSLGVLAQCPEARDLPLNRPSVVTSPLPIPGISSGGVLGDLIASRDVLIVAGRARDIVDVLVRNQSSLERAGAKASTSVVACALDAGSIDVSRLGPGDGRTVVAARISGDIDAEDTRAWKAWTSRVGRSRKQVAVFRVPRADPGRGLGDDYVVTVEDSGHLNLDAFLDYPADNIRFQAQGVQEHKSITD